MQYSVPITVLPTNTQSNPASVDAHFGPGLLYKVDVVFPPGPAGLVHIYIMHGGTQILPTTAGQTYSGDGIHIYTRCFIMLPDPDNVVTIKGYSVGCTYSHKVLLLFEVQSLDRVDWLHAL